MLGYGVPHPKRVHPLPGSRLLGPLAGAVAGIVPLEAASAASTATLNVTAKTAVVLQASSAVSSATLYVTAGAAGPDPVTSWLRVREKPSLAHSVMVETPTGKVYRWGEDDRIPERSFHDLSYGGGMPGGFDQMTCTLPRKANIDYSDLDLFSTIQIFDAGGEVVGEYRLDSAMKTAGAEFVISPNAVGYQAELEDRRDCAMVFVDIDLSHWGEASTQRQINLQNEGGINYPYNGPAVKPDVTTGNPSLWTGATVDSTGGATNQRSEALYDLGAFVSVGSIYYAWTRHPNTPTSGAGNLWQVLMDDNDTMLSAVATSNLLSAGPGSGTLTKGVSDNRFAGVQWYIRPEYAITGDAGIFWTMLAVYGDHGLTKRGSESATTAKGFYASDVIRYVVENFTNLNVGTIDATTFVIPQLEFRTPTTPVEMITQANRFRLNDWFVGPGQTFHYRVRGHYGQDWIARVGPSRLESTGQTTERCITDVLISYQDVDGTPRTAGPTGSAADSTSDLLHDSNTQNPANIAGIERWATLDMGGVSTAAAASQVGSRFIEEINAADHSGRAELTGHVMNTAGALFPFSSVQAGDTITFLDAADTSPRRIVKVSKGANTVSLDLDAPPEGTQALLERLGVQWTNLSARGAPAPKPKVRPLIYS